MRTPFVGFCGESYPIDGKFAAVERTVNWYYQPIEAPGEGKSRAILLPCPGNKAFSRLPVPAPFNQPCRGLLEYRGTVYGVNGNIAYSLSATGVYTLIGRLLNDGLPVSMVANASNQIFIASAGTGYVIQAGNPSTFVTPGVEASYATFQDGYVLIITPNSNQFQISGDDDTPLGDATKWSAANVSVQAGQADYLAACISSREYIRLFGTRRSQVYYNVGSNGIGGFPFQNYSETFIETGIDAVFSLAELPDSLMWIGQDSRGVRACWRDHGFQPQRVSTFAVESVWQNYTDITGAVAFPYVWRGHLFYQITFPNAAPGVAFPLGNQNAPPQSRTWVYDATASEILGRPIWFERQYQTSLGEVQGRAELFHCYAYGLHLVGSGGADGNPGAVYQYADPINANYATEPYLLLRWSNDGGNLYGREIPLSCAKMGNYAQRVYLNRVGYARDRVFWVRASDTNVWGTDCGTDINGNQTLQPVVRDRICPHIWQNNNRIIYNRIEFELSRGTGMIGIAGAELDVIECAS